MAGTVGTMAMAVADTTMALREVVLIHFPSTVLIILLRTAMMRKSKCRGQALAWASVLELVVTVKQIQMVTVSTMQTKAMVVTDMVTSTTTNRTTNRFPPLPTIMKRSLRSRSSNRPSLLLANVSVTESVLLAIGPSVVQAKVLARAAPLVRPTETDLVRVLLLEVELSDRVQVAISSSKLQRLRSRVLVAINNNLLLWRSPLLSLLANNRHNSKVEIQTPTPSIRKRSPKSYPSSSASRKPWPPSLTIFHMRRKRRRKTATASSAL